MRELRCQTTWPLSDHVHQCENVTQLKRFFRHFASYLRAARYSLQATCPLSPTHPTIQGRMPRHEPCHRVRRCAREPMPNSIISRQYRSPQNCANVSIHGTLSLTPSIYNTLPTPDNRLRRDRLLIVLKETGDRNWRCTSNPGHRNSLVARHHEPMLIDVTTTLQICGHCGSRRTNGLTRQIGSIQGEEEHPFNKNTLPMSPLNTPTTDP